MYPGSLKPRLPAEQGPVEQKCLLEVTRSASHLMTLLDDEQKLPPAYWSRRERFHYNTWMQSKPYELDTRWTTRSSRRSTKWLTGVYLLPRHLRFKRGRVSSIVGARVTRTPCSADKHLSEK